MLDMTQRQLNLKTYGYYYKGAIDGIEGPLTINAYTNFQRNHQLEVDGIYGVNTNAKLISCIKNLQSTINKFGYNLEIDGMVGPITIEAIRDFQSKNGLEVDGIVGPLTSEKLGITIGKEIKWEDIKHFVREEFTCECGCGLNNINMNLVKILDDIREMYNSPLYITSGCRCPSCNAAVGGVPGSRHITGKAADFYVAGVDVYTVLHHCENLVAQGVLRYTYTNETNMKGAVHIDIL